MQGVPEEVKVISNKMDTCYLLVDVQEIRIQHYFCIKQDDYFFSLFLGHPVCMSSEKLLFCLCQAVISVLLSYLFTSHASVGWNMMNMIMINIQFTLQLLMMKAILRFKRQGVTLTDLKHLGQLYLTWNYFKYKIRSWYFSRVNKVSHSFNSFKYSLYLNLLKFNKISYEQCSGTGSYISFD